MSNTINLKAELTKDGRVLNKSELAKLKKSNPSKEELDKLGVKITQENDTHIQMQLGDETIVNARFDREHESEGMTKPKQKGPQTTANSLKAFNKAFDDGFILPDANHRHYPLKIPLKDYARGCRHKCGLITKLHDLGRRFRLRHKL